MLAGSIRADSAEWLIKLHHWLVPQKKLLVSPYNCSIGPAGGWAGLPKRPAPFLPMPTAQGIEPIILSEALGGNRSIITMTAGAVIIPESEFIRMVCWLITVREVKLLFIQTFLHMDWNIVELWFMWQKAPLMVNLMTTICGSVSIFWINPCRL